jgi:MYXO-CTERM domain-containing protein
VAVQRWGWPEEHRTLKQQAREGGHAGKGEGGKGRSTSAPASRPGPTRVAALTLRCTKASTSAEHPAGLLLGLLLLLLLLLLRLSKAAKPS